MKSESRLMSFLVASRRLSWPALFAFGVFAGVAIGLSTGLPVTGAVSARDVPSSSILPPRAEGISESLAEDFERANTPLGPTPAIEAPLSPSLNRTSTGIKADASSGPIRLPAPLGQKPRIAIVIDDLGLSQAAFDRVNDMPGTITMAFLPYGEDAQQMVNSVSEDREVILHLPMEPKDKLADAGPDMLPVAADADELRRLVRLNLDKLDGYTGVNNHTGSRFTSHERGMRIVLEELHARNLFFLDSVTTNDRLAMRLASTQPWRVLERDVFIDPGGPATTTDRVKDQLSELESIAKQYGYAIGIAHPYDVTVETMGPWLMTAEARGFELVALSDLMPRLRAKAYAHLR